MKIIQQLSLDVYNRRYSREQIYFTNVSASFAITTYIWLNPSRCKEEWICTEKSGIVDQHFKQISPPLLQNVIEIHSLWHIFLIRFLSLQIGSFKY